MINQPLVSVLMTAYYREKYIAEAIESVLASTYTNFELIIVDDCSKDNTVAIAKYYEEKDKRIKVYVNEKNLGDYPNRNRAASFAKGEFIIYVDSDDKTLKNGIENCVNTIFQFPNANFGMYAPDTHTAPFILDSSSALRKHFFEKPFLMIGPGGTIIRRSFFEEISGYPEIYGPANDLYFNLKATCHSSIVMLPFEFLFYRRHEGQEINNSYGYLINNYRYLRDALSEIALPIAKEELAWIRRKNKRRFVVNIIRYLYKKHNIKKTKEAIQKAEFSLKDALIGIFHF